MRREVGGVPPAICSKTLLAPMRRSTGHLFLLLFVLLLGVRVVSICMHPASLSFRILPNLWVLMVLVGLARSGRRLLSSKPSDSRRRWPGALLFIAGLATTGFIGVVAWVDYSLGQRDNVGVYDDPYKVWAARGLVVEGPRITKSGTQNSIESIRLAFDRGAKGVEVDAYFDTALNQYVVSHDRPYNLKKGVLLGLGSLLEAVGDDGQFWLDLKKLSHLDRAQLAAAVAELETLTAKGDLKGRFYVEGEDPVNLRAFHRAGFLTIYDTHPLKDSNPWTPLASDLYKLVYYFGGHTVMGMNSGEPGALIYGPEACRALRNVPVFIYHTPDESDRLGELLAAPDVRVILVGDHSLDRYGLHGPARE